MKTVIVTGASSGIGYEIAKTFSQKQWKVIAIARNVERLEKLANDFENVETIPCDLSDKEAIMNLGEKLAGKSIDALINNAAIFKPNESFPDSDEHWDEQYNVNLLGPIRLTRVVWDSLKQSKGVVLNISSTLGIRPIKNTAAYSALKAAMNNWTQSLALEGADFGIRANALCPGIVDTPIHSYVGSEKPEDQEVYKMVQGAQPLGRTGKPADIAFLSFQFCQPEAAWTTGTIINVDGGILLNS